MELVMKQPNQKTKVDLKVLGGPSGPSNTTRVEFFWENASFLRYGGVNAANATNLLAKRR